MFYNDLMLLAANLVDEVFLEVSNLPRSMEDPTSYHAY